MLINCYDRQHFFDIMAEKVILWKYNQSSLA